MNGRGKLGVHDQKNTGPIPRFLRLLARIVLSTVAIVTILALGIILYYRATIYRAKAAQTEMLALTQATVLVGEGLEPHPNTTVLIRGGTITQVGTDVAIPPGATILDLSGYTVMPGLIDLHVHLGSQNVDAPGILTMPKLVADWVRYFPETRRAFLRHGVTTVRDLGNEYGWILDLRQQIQDGVLEGPRLFIAGPIFTTPGGHPVATFGTDPAADSVRLPATPEDARRAVRALARDGRRVDVIKVVQERGRPDRSLQPIAPDVLAAIVAEAHAHGMPVTGHWGTLQDLDELLAAGVDGLEHLEARGMREGWPDATLRLLVERDISLSPTLAVTDKVLTVQMHQQLRQRVGEFHAAGGRIVAGSDAPMQGLTFGGGLHRELALLVESGLTPQEALKAATVEAAKVLRADHLGVIAPGYAADLVVVEGDPTQQIETARNVVMVFVDGRLMVDQLDEKRK